MIKEYIFLVLAWIVFYSLHSILASTGVKQRIINLLGIRHNIYRMVYNLISVIGLMAVLTYNAVIKSQLLLPVSEFSRFISLFLAVVGVIIIRMAFRQYDIKEFLGLYSQSGDPRMHKKGILSHVRHPLYSGTILIILGLFLYIPNIGTLITAVCSIIYIAIGLSLEERKLIKEFGEKYKNYKRNVPALIPRFWEL